MSTIGYFSNNFAFMV